MGDRWSYPHQASAATYVWMPLQVEGTKISIPEYWQAWDIQTLRPVDILKEGKILSSEKITLPTDWKRKTARSSPTDGEVKWNLNSKVLMQHSSERPIPTADMPR